MRRICNPFRKENKSGVGRIPSTVASVLRCLPITVTAQLASIFAACNFTTNTSAHARYHPEAEGKRIESLTQFTLAVGPLTVIPTLLDSKTAITPEMPVYWRSSIHDGIYNFATILIRPGNRTSARFVGYQPGVVVEHIFSHHVSSTVGYPFLCGGFPQADTPRGERRLFLRNRDISILSLPPRPGVGEW